MQQNSIWDDIECDNHSGSGADHLNFEEGRLRWFIYIQRKDICYDKECVVNHG